MTIRRRRRFRGAKTSSAERKLIAGKLLAIAKELVSAREGYTMDMTYERWDEEALEVGDTDDRGWEYKNEKYDDLEELLNDSPVSNKSWVEWSSSSPGKGDWINSQEDQDYRTGERTYYSLFIKRADGKPLSKDEIKYINRELRIR